MDTIRIDRIIRLTTAAYVYIVDHDPSYSMSLKKAIDKPDKFSVQIFSTGEKFISHLTQLKFRKDDVHIVFLGYKFFEEGDHNLMNGIEILEATKVVNPDIEVVMLTGHDEGSFGSYAKKGGAYAFIQKSDTIFLRVENIIMRIISYKKLNQKRRAFFIAVRVFFIYCLLLALAAIIIHLYHFIQ